MNIWNGNSNANRKKEDWNNQVQLLIVSLSVWNK